MRPYLVAAVAVFVCMQGGGAASQSALPAGGISDTLELAEDLAAQGRSRGDPELLLAAAILARDAAVLNVDADGAAPVCSLTLGPAAPSALLADALRLASIGERSRYLIPRIHQLQATPVTPDCNTRGGTQSLSERTVNVRPRSTQTIRVPPAEGPDGQMRLRVVSTSTAGLTFSAPECPATRITGTCRYRSASRSHQNMTILNGGDTAATVTVRW
jgi:hypothetical protein